MAESLLMMLPKLFKDLVGVFFKFKERKQERVDRLAVYLSTVADCLEEIVENLKENKIPIKAGNRLKKAFGSFNELVEEAKLDEAKQGELEYAQGRIEKNLNDARFLDDVIRGNILHASETKKNEMLREMTRTSGYLMGVVDTLKANSL